MEIIEGIHRVDEASANMAHANVYLLINGKELTVIDTGTSGNAQKTVEYIQKLGYQPTDVKTIILTHYHMDHREAPKNSKTSPTQKLPYTRKTRTTSQEKSPCRNPKTFCSEPFHPSSNLYLFKLT